MHSRAAHTVEVSRAAHTVEVRSRVSRARCAPQRPVPMHSLFPGLTWKDTTAFRMAPRTKGQVFRTLDSGEQSRLKLLASKAHDHL